MPNCFTLTRKTDLCSGPVAFNKIDEEMCKHFGVPCDAKIYHAYWYDIFGFAIACGQTWETKREFFRGKITQHLATMKEATDTPTYKDANLDMFQNLHLIAIADWLEANFTADAWYDPNKK